MEVRDVPESSVPLYNDGQDDLCAFTSAKRAI